MRVSLCMLRSAIERRDGGAESLRNLAEGLRRFPDVDLSLLSSHGSMARHRAYAPYPWRDSRFIPLVRRFYRAAKRSASENDVTMLLLPNPSFALLADMLRRAVRRPVVVNYESRWHALEGYGFRGDNLGWKSVARLVAFNRLTSRLTPKLCDRYVVSTPFQKRELVQVGYDEARVVAIPNCTDLAKYRAVEAAPLVPGERTVMYIGHLNHSKGVDVLVRAMPDVLRSHPMARLWIVWSGGGREHDRLVSAIRRLGLEKSTSIVKGTVDVASYLSRADVLVLPYRSLSKTRIIPSLLLEAFSVGVPLVVCGCEPVTDVVKDRYTGIVAAVGDPAGVARGVCELLADGQLSRRIAASQREVAAKEFSHHEVAERYHELFREVAS